MSDDTIKAETRTEFGKGAARRIRRADKVPAVIYGHGNDPSPHHPPGPRHDDGAQARRCQRAAPPRRRGHDPLALTKQIQADPIKGFLEHIDFVEVKKGEKVTVEIPIHVVGESKPDAMTVTELNTVTVEAEATNIPEYIEISVEDAEVGFQILAKDLDLPSGSTLLTDDEYLVVNVVHAPTAEEIEAELEEAEAEAGIEHDLSDEAIAEPEREAAEAEEGAEGEGESAEGELLRRGLIRPADRSSARSGWSSGWATPARRTPAPVTTSGTSSPTSSPAGWGRAGGRTRPAGPTSSRGAWARRARTPRGSSWRARVAT